MNLDIQKLSVIVGVLLFVASCGPGDASIAPATEGAPSVTVTAPNEPSTPVGPAPPSAVAIPAPPVSELVKLATIEGKAANDEFTRNVQVLQAQRQEVVRLTQGMATVHAGKDREALQEQIVATVKKLDADNRVMAKSYGYSLLRNYTRVPEKSEVFLVLTADEIAQQPVPTDGSAQAKSLLVCSLNDPQSNAAFQSTVQKLQEMRQKAIALRVEVDSAKDETAKNYAQGQLDLSQKQLNDANAAAARTYGFNLNRDYVMSIEKSVLYIHATPDELAKVADFAEQAEPAKQSEPR